MESVNLVGTLLVESDVENGTNLYGPYDCNKHFSKFKYPMLCCTEEMVK